MKTRFYVLRSIEFASPRTPGAFIVWCTMPNRAMFTFCRHIDVIHRRLRHLFVLRAS